MKPNIIKNILKHDEDFKDLYNYLKFDSDYNRKYTFPTDNDSNGYFSINPNNNMEDSINAALKLIDLVDDNSEWDDDNIAKRITQLFFYLTIMTNIWDCINDNVLNNFRKKHRESEVFFDSNYLSKVQRENIFLDAGSYIFNNELTVNIGLSIMDKTKKEQHIIIRFLVNDKIIEDLYYLNLVHFQVWNRTKFKGKDVMVPASQLTTEYINDMINGII